MTTPIFAAGSTTELHLTTNRSPLCLARIRDGERTGWCLDVDGHEGKHYGVTSAPTTRSKR
jgi:hypothetical protein